MSERSSLPRRRNSLLVFREAAKFASYDEYPVLRPEIDPQLHASRNEDPQPFYLILEKDCVLIQASGRGAVLFRHGDVTRFALDPGDFVYIPGGTPHRIIPDGMGLYLRYKARDPGLEGVAWYCDQCGTQLDRMVWEPSLLPQEGYEQAAQRFNDRAASRICGQCAHPAPPIDLSRYRWRHIAQALRAEQSVDGQASSPPAGGGSRDAG